MLEQATTMPLDGHPWVDTLTLSNFYWQINKQVNPAASNNYAIRLASTRGHAEVVKLLLADERVDAGADNNQAIKRASEKGHLDVVKMIASDTITYATAPA